MFGPKIQNLKITEQISNSSWDQSVMKSLDQLATYGIVDINRANTTSILHNEHSLIYNVHHPTMGRPFFYVPNNFKVIWLRDADGHTFIS